MRPKRYVACCDPRQDLLAFESDVSPQAFEEAAQHEPDSFRALYRITMTDR